MKLDNLVRVIHRLVIALSLCLLAGIRPGSAAADLGSTVRFDIPPQALPSALLKYSEQSGVQVTSSGEVIEGKVSGGVVGAFAARGALEKLLDGTRLAWREIDPNTVAIWSPPAQRKPDTSARVYSGAASDAAVEAPKRSFPERLRLAQATGGGEASAQDAPSAATEVVITGSRFGRTAAESATPIDVIGDDALQQAAPGDLQGKLRTLVPSFSLTSYFAAGSLDFMASPSLRGLSTGELLVLLDGKRRIASADGGGDVAYDLNAIPLIALSRVEVLRDGAAAQYGSDAIAGVVNLGLDASLGFRAEARYGKTNEGDGEAKDIGVAYGFALPNEGVLRVSFSHQDHEHTNRALPDTRQQYLGSNGTVAPSALYGSGTGLTPSAGVLDPREATIDRNVWVSGEPDYKNNAFFYNARLPLAGALAAYSFGGYNELKGTSYNFFRRAGQDQTLRSIYPDGFLPLQKIELKNTTFVAGLKGEGLLGFAWDASINYGKNELPLRYDQSANVSQGNASKTSFYRGAYTVDQKAVNVDLKRAIGTGDEPLKLAVGLEYRQEDFDTSPGEVDSYIYGGVPILDGPNAGAPAPAGAQPGGGIRPEDALDGDRHSTAAYAELDKTFFGRWQFVLAGRFEDYSDFGSTTNYKLATRFAVNDSVALRASTGSGFRAPSLAQSYFSRTNVSFINGQPVRSRFLSTSDPLAAQVGAPSLGPEESDDYSVGSVLRIGGLTASVDYYHIRIDDRIIASSTFQGGTLAAFMAANGQPDVTGLSFLTNAVDTTTRGVDLTAGYRASLGSWGNLSATLALNFNKTKIRSIDTTPAQIQALGITTTLFDLTQQTLLTDSRPKDKQVLSFSWQYDRFTVGLTGTRYGDVSEVALTGLTPARVNALLAGGDYTTELVPTGATNTLIQTFTDKTVADLDVAFAATDAAVLTLGVANLFDTYPDTRIASTTASAAAGANGSDNAGTLPYSYFSPFGTAGRAYYAKLSVRF